MIKTGFLIGLIAVIALFVADGGRLQRDIADHLRGRAEFLPYLASLEQNRVSASAQLTGKAESEQMPNRVMPNPVSSKVEATDNSSQAVAEIEPLTDDGVAEQRELEPEIVSPPAARYSLWPAFTTRTSADGLARRLRQQTGLTIEAEREAHNRYLVLLRCGSSCELGSALTLIESQTGLTPLPGVLR